MYTVTYFNTKRKVNHGVDQGTDHCKAGEAWAVEVRLRAGLHVSTISQIENGHLVPYPGQVKKMLAAFERLEAKERLQKVAS